MSAKFSSKEKVIITNIPMEMDEETLTTRMQKSAENLTSVKKGMAKKHQAKS